MVKTTGRQDSIGSLHLSEATTETIAPQDGVELLPSADSPRAGSVGLRSSLPRPTTAAHTGAVPAPRLPHNPCGACSVQDSTCTTGHATSKGWIPCA